MFIKKILIIPIISFLIMFPFGNANAIETNADYSTSPLFLADAVTPNIFIIMSTSGTMNKMAYTGAYNPGTQYYGYFDKTSPYSYASNTFNRGAGIFSGNFLNWGTTRRIDAARKVIGGGLATSRTGGGNANNIGENSDTPDWDQRKCGQDSDAATLAPNVGARYAYSIESKYFKIYDFADGVNDGIDLGLCTTIYNNFTDEVDFTTDEPAAPVVGGYYLNTVTGRGSITGGGTTFTAQNFYLWTGAAWTEFEITDFATLIDTYTLDINKDVSEEPDDFYEGNLAGIMQKIETKGRFGLETYNDGCGIEPGCTGPNAGDDGGTVGNPITGTGYGVNFITNLTNTDADGYQPIAEALYTAISYFAQDTSAYPEYQNSDWTAGNDPFDYDGTDVECPKNFIIIVTDGSPTHDINIDNEYDKNILDSYDDATYDYYNSTGLDTETDLDGNGTYRTDFLDDVAYYAHTTDLRADLDGNQNLIIYVVYAFGDGSAANLLKETAKNGGFTDIDGGVDDQPDNILEWDTDGDGDPDNYAEASDGEELEEKLMAQINDILKRASSGTAISVLATSASGAGNIYQAYFYPETTYLDAASGTSWDVEWMGHLNSLGVDALGQLNDDTGAFCVVYYFDSDDGTRVKVTNKNADLTCDYDSVVSDTTLADFQDYVWDAGEVMMNRDPSLDNSDPLNPASAARNIYTFHDGRSGLGALDGKCDSCTGPGTGEFVSFNPSEAANLRTLFGVDTVAEAEDIIKWMRGQEVSGLRDRTILESEFRDAPFVATQWMLGDIVHSTPTVVAAPMENYDIRYQDTTFTEFYDAAASRRSMVYIGANDGMLHALDATTGQEIWGFIPYNILPHLKWLTRTTYSHTYYVDLKSKVTDVQIFTCDATHLGPGLNGKCWGTVLVGGLRFGGGEITNSDYDLDGDGDVDADDTALVTTFRSAYFALDITDPENPTLLWEFGHVMPGALGDDNALGFTMSYPTIVSVEGEWFVVFGSGPQGEYVPDYEGFPSATQTARLFVLDLVDGTYRTSFATAHPESFMSNPIAIDMDGATVGTVVGADTFYTYGPDAIYVGETWKDTQGASTYWSGTMYRIVINDNNAGTDDTNPTNWQLTTFYETDRDQPITSAPALSMDSTSTPWLFFGTGKYLSGDDKSDISPTNQSFFGIKDQCWPGMKWDTSAASCNVTVVKTDLVSTTGTQVIDDGTGTGNVTVSGGDIAGGSSFDDVIAQVAAKDGWYFDLDSDSEKSFNKPTIIGGLVLFTTFEPGQDICGFGGDSFFYAVFYETGTAYMTSTIGTDVATNEISRRESAGTGMASSVAVHSGRQDGASAFVQLSTGEATAIGFTPALDIKSKIISWREL